MVSKWRNLYVKIKRKSCKKLYIIYTERENETLDVCSDNTIQQKIILFLKHKDNFLRKVNVSVHISMPVHVLIHTFIFV